MNHKRWITLALAALLLGLFVLQSAEARRFGGGMNFGKSYKYSRPAKPFRPAPKQAPAQPRPQPGAAPAGRRGGWLGPLAGLAAGGLLGALLFGGAFEGLRLFDVLVVGGLAFLAIYAFRRLAGGGAVQRREVPAGGAPPLGTAPPPAHGAGIEVPEIGEALRGAPLSAPVPWFDEGAFLAEAKDHFLALQRAWDRGDWDTIRDYVTPDLLAALRREHGGRPHHTEVVQLEAQLLDLLEDGDDVVAAILFSGLIREDGGEAAPFAEIWHVRHPRDTAAGPWRLAGIRQYEGA